MSTSAEIQLFEFINLSIGLLKVVQATVNWLSTVWIDFYGKFFGLHQKIISSNPFSISKKHKNR